jgi:preprotein translocase subunit Sss1
MFFPPSNFTEFFQVAIMTAVGFLAVGGLGFITKLLHIPINQILMS